MGDVLLLFHGLMKVMLIVAIMVLVATAPRPASAPRAEMHADLSDAVHQDDRPSWGRRMLHADGDSHGLDGDDNSPSMNLDGTPMCGDIDIDGNFFGDCGEVSTWDD